MQLTIQRDINVSLTRQVYNQISALIMNGVLKAGEKLPSTRDLAMELDLSRNIILEAYEQLTIEGYLETMKGSGTYVAPGAYWEAPSIRSQPTLPQTSPVSQRLQNRKPASRIDFRSGIPALELFPRKKWASLSYRYYLDTPVTILGYDYPEGRYELRDAICQYLLKNRGVRCSPDQLIITSGSIQGLALITQKLIGAGAHVILEDPTNRDIERILIAPRASIHPVPADAQGIQTKRLPDNIHPALILVTPSHQFPLGGTLPVQRRIELIRYARDHQSLIVEDDYDSEYRYEGPPASSLQSLAPERVIYLGTFSKILFPGLRLGFMMLPLQLVEEFRMIKRLADFHSNSINQLVLAHFIREGYLERHISRMRKIYRKRRDGLVSALTASFQNQVTVSGASTGLHLIAEFAGIEFPEELVKYLDERAGVKVYPVEELAQVKGFHRSKIILGYGSLSETEICQGVERLKEGLLKAT